MSMRLSSVIVQAFLVASAQGIDPVTAVGDSPYAAWMLTPGQEYGVQAMPRGSYDNKHGRCCCQCYSQPCNYGYRCYPPEFGHEQVLGSAGGGTNGWQYICIDEPRLKPDGKGGMMLAAPLQEVRKYQMMYFPEVNNFLWINRHKYKDKMFTNYQHFRDLSNGIPKEAVIPFGGPGETRKIKEIIHTHECTGLYHEDGKCDVKHTCKDPMLKRDCDMSNGVQHTCMCAELCTPPAAPPLPPFAPYPPGLPPFIPPVGDDSPAAGVTSSIVQPLLALVSTVMVFAFYARA